MNQVPMLGKIIEGPEQRDAIHIAIAPVVAAGKLQPGQHIGFVDDGKADALTEKKIGIVDPFLTKPVKAGERFWMFLYPNTITSLRHDWSHPSFAASGVGVTSESEKWLRDFAEEVGAEYHNMMWVASTHDESSSDRWGEYLIQGGKWEGQETPEEFWTHYKNVTGKGPKDGPVGIFSCSC